MRIQKTSQLITMFIVVLSLLTIGCAIWSRYYRIIQESIFEQRRLMFNSTEQLARGSDRLTAAVRAYAVTGERHHYDAFQKELMVDRNRDIAVEGLRQIGLTPLEQQLINTAKLNSDNLVRLENQALAAVASNDLARATQLVYGREYETAKAAIMDPIAECRRVLEQRLTTQAMALAGRARLLTNIALVFLILNAGAMTGALLMFYRRRVVNPLAQLNRNLRDLLAKKSEARVEYQEDASEIGELARSMESYRISVEEAERQRWVKTRAVDMSESLQGVEQGGCIWLESEPGRGSTFYFTVWLGIGAAASAKVVPERLSKLRVLVVDDNPAAREILQEPLSTIVCHVDAVGSGMEAITAIQKQDSSAPYDLIFMDWRMPGMDGFQATGKIRADGRFKTMPIVAMTAHATIEERRRCLAAGMNEHVSKPIDPGLLFETVGRFYQTPSESPPQANERPQVPQNDEALPDVPGLDTFDGLSRVGKNRKLYLKLLRQFVEQQGPAGEQIASALVSDDNSGAERLAHTLKGVAANLGARTVQTAAGALEKAIRERAPAEQIKSAQEQLRKSSQNYAFEECQVLVNQALQNGSMTL